MPKKGNIPWNKGMKGVQIAWNKGLRLSEEHIQGLREAKLNNPVRYWFGKKRPEIKDYIVQPRKEKHWNWRGGVNPINDTIRKSLQYKLWRKAIFERDNYTCILCKEHGKRLNADHIKPFAFFPELRFDVSNGRTLCEDCHKKTDTYGRKAFMYNTANSFNRWMLIAKAEQA
jgi:5-methylcytosine-specific restriction endonuclease McrA